IPSPPLASASEPGDTQPARVAAEASAPPPARTTTQPGGKQVETTAAALLPPPASAMAAASAAPLGKSTTSSVADEKPISGTASRSTRVGGKASTETGGGLRKQGEPPEPGPMESSLEIPQARAPPQPEQPQPAPPPPQLPPTPKVVST